jgi:hypothetical protein
MQRGVGVAGSSVGFVNVQTRKRDATASSEGGWGGGVGLMLGVNRIGISEPRRQVYLGYVPNVPPKRRLLQDPHGVTSKKTPFFTVTAVKTSDRALFCHLQFLEYEK